MNLAIARQPDALSWVPPPYLELFAAAEQLGRDVAHLRRICRDCWGPAGLAKKFDGAWGIHPRADQRLHSGRDLAKRDREQIAELECERVAPRRIDLARAKRDIVVGLADYEGDARSPRDLRRFYIAHLFANGTLPGDGIKELSVTTLYRWQRQYDVGGIRSLVRKASTASDNGEVTGRAALDYIFNLRYGANNIDLATAITITRGEATKKHKGDPAWRIGSYSSIRLAIEARTPYVLKVLADKGERAAEGKCVPKRPRDYESIPANAEWVGDERTLDIWCRVCDSRRWRAIRPKFTTWMDMRSRVITGWVLAPHADNNTILGALKTGIRDYGIPDILRVDWGRDYKNALQTPETMRWKYRRLDAERIKKVVEELDIKVQPTLKPYQPWVKPVESFYATMKDHFDRLFASFWGGCPSERHEDRQRYLKEHLERVMPLDSLIPLLARFIDNYHHTPHGAVAMFGKTPLQALEAFRETDPRKESAAALDHLFRSYTKPHLVRRDGIRFEGHWYGHGDPRLTLLQGKKVLLGFQPDDASKAMVCGLDKTPSFEIDCPPLRGYTKREAKAKARARRAILRPYAEQAREAKKFFRALGPNQLLDNYRAGVEALHGNGEPEQKAPPALIVRPALEEALANAGPAPREQASKAVRTGTDEDAITVDDILDADVPDDWQARPDESACEDIDFFGLDNPGGDP